MCHLFITSFVYILRSRAGHTLHWTDIDSCLDTSMFVAVQIDVCRCSDSLCGRYLTIFVGILLAFLSLCLSRFSVLTSVTNGTPVCCQCHPRGCHQRTTQWSGHHDPRIQNGSVFQQAWASYQIRKIADCACARNAGNVFPATDFKGNRYIVSDPGMHHDTCVSHVSWCMSGSLTRDGGENVPSISGTCTTHNFTYLSRRSWGMTSPWCFMVTSDNSDLFLSSVYTRCNIAAWYCSDIDAANGFDRNQQFRH